jgi:hypothetical protein
MLQVAGLNGRYHHRLVPGWNAVVLTATERCKEPRGSELRPTLKLRLRMNDADAECGGILVDDWAKKQ